VNLDYLYNREEALKYLDILVLKFNKNAIVSYEYLNKEIFLNYNIREIVSTIEKISRDGYPSHSCWNDCHKMCEEIYSICHIVCFHCCQMQGQGPICD